jgi:ATP-binding cassette subfamily B protein
VRLLIVRIVFDVLSAAAHFRPRFLFHKQSLTEKSILMAAIEPNQPITYFDFRKALSPNKLKGIWRMMTGYKLAYAGATTALAVSAIARTSTYLLLGYFTDKILSTGNNGPAGIFTNKLLLVAIGFVLLATVEGLFSYISGRLAAFTAEGITRRLRNYLFDHLQRLTFTYHAKTPTGDQIERVTSDVDALRRFYSEQAIGVGRIILLFLINFLAILRLNSTLAWASVVVIPFILVVSLWFFKKVTAAYEKYQEQEATLSTTLQENLTGVRVVKAFARQDFEKNKFEKDNFEKYLRGKKLLYMHSLFWPLSDIVLGFQMLAGYMLGATMAINGVITIGTYVTYTGLVVWLIWPIRNLGRLIVSASTGMVSYGRIMDIVKQDREPLTDGTIASNESPKGEVVFDHVSFSYNGDESQVLNNVSFRVLPGQSLALLGSTGSGKTSLVNLLPRFYDYTNGQILLDGNDLKEYSREYLRRHIGIVEQEPFLFSRSIRENITYGVGRHVPMDEVEKAAKAAAIHAVIMEFPDKYDTLVGEKGVTLSGGQKQRVTIARTLLKNPRILILDDSTSSVDTETEAEIRKALNNLMENRTTFIIAHRIQSVMNADTIVVLDKGEIVEIGNHKELVAGNGMYRKIYESRLALKSRRELPSGT